MSRTFLSSGFGTARQTLLLPSNNGYVNILRVCRARSRQSAQALKVSVFIGRKQGESRCLKAWRNYCAVALNESIPRFLSRHQIRTERLAISRQQFTHLFYHAH